ncbi:hypothetical protein O6P43_013659 [Quillaja saponaria]|uniref:Uncharacterized protein n=1 Tax=Quillaja saponaria TaxID=32244 RepID=A0AAD7LSY9_QUISA|nr:hypothetical protein O6P43_013659 [Quillaja saponaria]KAJ7963745.1 hypothetical protein O6P43_013659 [Quillaja saponaria]
MVKGYPDGKGRVWKQGQLQGQYTGSLVGYGQVGKKRMTFCGFANMGAREVFENSTVRRLSYGEGNTLVVTWDVTEYGFVGVMGPSEAAT